MKVRLRVKEVAIEKGISQSRLSRLADVDPKTIRKIYREPYSSTSTMILARIASALSVQVEALIETVPDGPTAEE